MIKVQTEAFDVGAELAALKGHRTDIGGFALFVGSVRDLSGGKDVTAMTLEHYPGMTEAALAEIETQARARWELQDALIIHRYGRLHPGDDIVLVITASAHRAAAFDACAFLMDFLKTKAPFWKLEESSQGVGWVEAKASDEQAAARWEKQS
ncbi:molybdenum cofactor biosynthesis protein MoaE [Aestuariivirga litoralis]|uniref:molybdenum cofactor biosynthesis protein MoaE n=1 Tax=Aestuariivirga litoralis TaxID=2650924 RepID=UPI0018C58A0B|nr:molybdenum cofactor biosynthesis protein MoaE [Aestuariivirga litoralis]MBG1233479.1 molybdenum cofactor biosynthesis protein MoaE [Aestuariivirga litoralis]